MHGDDELALTETHYHEYGVREVHQIFPEYYLIRVGKFSDEIRDHVDEWIYMLKHSEVKPEFAAKNIQQAGEKLRVMRLSSDRRKAYNRFMENRSYEASMLYSSRREGRLESRVEGRREGIEQVAKNMLAQGMESPVVASVTGLSAEAVEKLLSEL